MKLNADIIFDHLKQEFDLEMFGEGKRELTLQRPKFFCKEAILKDCYVYVAFSERLPLDVKIEGMPVMVCLGGKPPLIYRRSCCYMVCKNTDLFLVFDAVQQIFEKFAIWEQNLLEVLNTTADMQEILDICDPIIENPMVVMNVDFNFLAYSSIINTHDKLTELNDYCHKSYSADTLAWSVDNEDFNMHTVEPFLLCDEHGNTSVYASNLFVDGKNVGNLVIHFLLRDYQKNDPDIFSFLVLMLERAFVLNPRLYNNYVDPLPSILKDILNGMPIEASRGQLLTAPHTENTFLCAKIIMTSFAKAHMTASYIINQFEMAFPEIIIFEYENSFAAFLPLDSTDQNAEAAEKKICEQLKMMVLKGATSCPFHNLLEAWDYYKQATLALELGWEKSMSMIGMAIQTTWKRCMFI